MTVAKSLGVLNGVAARLHALGIIPDPALVQRVVIDLRAGQLPTVHIRCFGDERLLEVLSGIDNAGDLDVKT